MKACRCPLQGQGLGGAARRQRQPNPNHSSAGPQQAAGRAQAEDGGAAGGAAGWVLPAWPGSASVGLPAAAVTSMPAGCMCLSQHACRLPGLGPAALPSSQRSLTVSSDQQLVSTTGTGTRCRPPRAAHAGELLSTHIASRSLCKGELAAAQGLVIDVPVPGTRAAPEQQDIAAAGAEAEAEHAARQQAADEGPPL